MCESEDLLQERCAGAQARRIRTLWEYRPWRWQSMPSPRFFRQKQRNRREKHEEDGTVSFFPLVIDWQGLPCLVAGGGAVALHKAELLCAHGAEVTVAAPAVCPELRALPVRILERPVTAEDVADMRLVVDATGSEEAEALLSSACRERKIPFNSACRAGDGTAVFPAVERKGRVLVAVSTLGASPAACARLRDELARHVPEEMDAILDAMAALRPLSRAWFSNQGDRKRFLRLGLNAMLKTGRPLAEDETETLRQEILKSNTTKETEK